MPIYSYHCKNCGYQFDDMRSMADADEPTFQACPECKKVNTVGRIISASNFHLKGSGWFKQVKPS